MVQSPPEIRRWTYDRDDHPFGLRVPELHIFGHDHFLSATPIGPHTHKNCYEFVFVEKGKAAWEVEGEEYETRSGDVFHTRPDERHSGRFNIIEPSKLWWLIFDDPGSYDSWLGISREETEHIRDSLLELPRIIHNVYGASDHLQKLKQAVVNDEALSALRARHYIMQIVLMLMEPERKVKVAEDLEDVILNLTHEMKAQPDMRVSMDRLAARVGVSTSHFHKVFRKVVKCSPYEFMERNRIESACRRLADTNESVTAIAFDLGFKTTQHFATVFRKFLGISPTQWRSQHKL